VAATSRPYSISAHGLPSREIAEQRSILPTLELRQITLSRDPRIHYR